MFLRLYGLFFSIALIYSRRNIESRKGKRNKINSVSSPYRATLVADQGTTTISSEQEPPLPLEVHKTTQHLTVYETVIIRSCVMSVIETLSDGLYNGGCFDRSINQWTATRRFSSYAGNDLVNATQVIQQFSTTHIRPIMIRYALLFKLNTTCILFTCLK